MICQVEEGNKTTPENTIRSILNDGELYDIASDIKQILQKVVLKKNY
jgi:hypothetical protein